jgi:hypothetical protein
MEKDKPKISPADPTPPNSWVISDKESLIAWVSRFLWHYEGMASGNGPEEAPDNPALIIVDGILMALPVLKGDAGKSKPVHLPDPEIYFQDEDNP